MIATATRPVRISLPPGFDFSWALGFLAARTVPSLESVADGVYRRSVRLNGEPVTLTLRESAGRASGAIVVTSTPRLSGGELKAVVTRMLDLDAEIDGFRRLARRDPILSGIVRRRSGIRLPQLLDPFEGLTRGILGQQVSVAGASTLVDRLVRLVSSPSLAASGALLAFPTAAEVAGVGVERLRAIGLTRVRAATMIGVASRIAEGALDLEALRGAPAEHAQAALEALPGIGPWTASYVRMRALGDRDAFPAADLGVIKAMAAAGIDRRSISAVAERWKPWRGYATLHLWASLSG